MGHSLTTATILTVFTDGVQDHNGCVTDTFNDGSRLFLRSLLPFVEEVRPDDRMQGGLALRATESGIWLHPFLFREVCSNGAIMAHSLKSCHLDFSQFATEDEVIGHWHTTHHSGAMQTPIKEQLQERVVKLQQAIKQAREEANNIEVVSQTVGAKVLAYIFE